jgi:hypothetical protein
MDYKQKLRDWNNTEKYKGELLFLNSLLSEYKSMVLDYGCGRGMAAYIIGADGYDINDYNECLDKEEYFNILPEKDYSDIYFLHSFAHIPNPLEVLTHLKDNYQAQITVITPNKDWLDEGYNNDTTVIRHYSQEELKDLFEYSGYNVTSIGQFGELKNGFNERIFLQAI